MLVIITMFILMLLVLALIGGGIYWWINRDDIDIPAINKLLGGKGSGNPKSATSDVGDGIGYRKRSGVLGSNEIKCMAALLKVGGSRARVLPKIRLADMVNVNREHADDRVLANRLASHHVDFLLAHPQTLSPVIAVNLERKPKRDESGDVIPGQKPRTDPFSEDVLRIAGIPLLKIFIREEYDAADISRRVKLVMAGNTSEQDAELDPPMDIDHRVSTVDRMKGVAGKLQNRLPQVKLGKG